MFHTKRYKYRKTEELLHMAMDFIDLEYKTLQLRLFDVSKDREAGAIHSRVALAKFMDINLGTNVITEWYLKCNGQEEGSVLAYAIAFIAEYYDCPAARSFYDEHSGSYMMMNFSRVLDDPLNGLRDRNYYRLIYAIYRTAYYDDLPTVIPNDPDEFVELLQPCFMELDRKVQPIRAFAHSIFN